MTDATVQLQAYAKLNLTLEVLGRRDDGFHEIRSLMQTISLADDLAVAKRNGQGDVYLALQGAAEGIPEGDENLAVRAAGLVLGASAGRSSDLQIRLTKRIPPAAGLGGGSSDAAAVLRAGSLLFRPAIHDELLAGRAASIGSDVPFFLRGGTQLARGRGEQLEVLPDQPRRWFVLVSPPLLLPFKTQRMYQLLRRSQWTSGAATEGVAARIKAGDAAPFDCFNVFDQVADEAFPQLAPYRRVLREACGCAVLCGAGPSLFASVDGEVAARQATRRICVLGLPAATVHTVTRDETVAARRVCRA